MNQNPRSSCSRPEAALPQERHSARGALTALSLSILMASLATSVANVALPTLAEAFDASFQDAQWVVLAYLLAITTLIVSAGRLGDLTGRRRLLVIGVVLFTAASALCGVAPTLWALIAARAVQGLGAAIMMAIAMALVSETVPKERTGRAMGLLGTMSATGTALGPSLGGLLIAGFGWRAIFLVTVPLGVLTAGLVQRHLPADQQVAKQQSAGLDNRGTVLLAVSLAAYTLAMTVGRGDFGLVNIALLIAAVAVGAVFAFAQTKTRSPLIRPAMLRSRLLSAGLATSALVSTVMMTTLVVGPFYLTGALGLGAGAVGLVMSVGPLVAAFTGVPAGRLVDRIGAQRTTVAGLAGIATGAVALAAIPASFDVAGYIAALVVLTVSYAVFQTANNTNVMTGVGPSRRGVTSGMLNLSRNLGLITGASAMGAVFSVAAGAGDIKSAPAASVASAMHVTFLVAAVLIVAALAIASASRTAGAPQPATAG